MNMNIIYTPSEAKRIARVAGMENAQDFSPSDIDNIDDTPSYLEKDKRRAVRRKKTIAIKRTLYRKSEFMGVAYVKESGNGKKHLVHRNHHRPSFKWNRYTNRVERHKPISISMEEYSDVDVEIPQDELLFHKQSVYSSASGDVDNWDLKDFDKSFFSADDDDDDDDDYNYYDWDYEDWRYEYLYAHEGIDD